MPLPAGFFSAFAPAAVTAVSGFLSQLAGNRSARRESRRMMEYNSPKQQMKRFREAGLSPYLMYGQGTPGNMTSPIPAQEYGGEHVASGFENYVGRRQANMDYTQSTIARDIMLNQMQASYWNASTAFEQNRIAQVKADRDTAEFWSDFPRFMKDAAVTPDVVGTGYRMKMNELKKSLSEANFRRLESMIQNMDHKTAIEAVKRKYAEDYGMVGGDWTQGLGLIKSIPSLFKGSRAIPKLSGLPSKEKSLLREYRRFNSAHDKRDANRFLFEQLRN